MNTTVEKTENEIVSPGASNGSGRVAANRRQKAMVIGVVFVAIGGVLAAGIVPRLRAEDKLARSVQQNARMSVIVTNVTRAAAAPELTLPATVRAHEETTLYSRTNGYLSKWFVDIGGKVEAGQVLAEIDTPELDQELNQARAALAQAEANLTLARSTAIRWKGLLKDRAVSEQEVEEKDGALAAREADHKAATA